MVIGEGVSSFPNLGTTQSAEHTPSNQVNQALFAVGNLRVGLVGTAKGKLTPPTYVLIRNASSHVCAGTRGTRAFIFPLGSLLHLPLFLWHGIVISLL